MKNNKIKNLTGMTFGSLTVLEKAYDIYQDTMWLCECSCGLKLDVSSNNLMSGMINACEYCSGIEKTKRHNKKIAGLLNVNFGDLTIISEISPTISKNGRKRRLFECKCSCGRTAFVYLCKLKSGKVTSCGCKEQNIRRLKQIWKLVLYRTDPSKCKNEKVKKNYIDRNITVCDEWKDFNIFKEWAINNGYSDLLTIDRINNNKGYYPGNCRWITQRENSCNKRNSVKLPNGHSFCDLLWNLGITTNDTRYSKYLNYYKKFKVLHQDIIEMIDSKKIDINKII